MLTTILVISAVVSLALLAIATFRARERGREREATKTIRDLSAMGDVVAGGRHPKIDPMRCIGSGACVMACPEKGVLAVVKGRGVLANPLACVGHGLCFEACPLEAITLVYGSETQALELPKVDERFETNQPGIYIVGELGGMGLIRNAVTQGVTAARQIAEGTRRGGEGVHDAIVVGAGPAGISATLGLLEAKLDVLLIDREALGGTIRHYPRAKLVMTGTLALPLYGTVRKSTMKKEELIELWGDIDGKVKLPFRADAFVEDVQRTARGHFEVRSTAGSFHAANVVLALGRRGSPRKLGVPGEDKDKVMYGLLEPREFEEQRVLVVGGGNFAVESAISLAESGVCKTVAISYRRADFARCRGDNRERMAELIESGTVIPMLRTEVVEVGDADVTLRVEGEREERHPFDSVIVQIGGTPPSELLARVGVHLVKKQGDE